MRKRILSLILAALMIVSLFPTAMAAEEPEMPVDEAVETVPEAPADQAPAEPAPAEPAPVEPEVPAEPVPVEPEEPEATAEPMPAPVVEAEPAADVPAEPEAAADEPEAASISDTALDVPVTIATGLADDPVNVQVGKDNAYTVSFSAVQADLDIYNISESDAITVEITDGNTCQKLSITVPDYYTITKDGNANISDASAGEPSEDGNRTISVTLAQALSTETGHKEVSIALSQAPDVVGISSVGRGISGDTSSKYYKVEDKPTLSYIVTYGQKLTATADKEGAPDPQVESVNRDSGVKYNIATSSLGGHKLTIGSEEATKLQADHVTMDKEWYLYPAVQTITDVQVDRGWKLDTESGTWYSAEATTIDEDHVTYKLTTNTSCGDGSTLTVADNSADKHTLSLDTPGNFTLSSAKIKLGLTGTAVTNDQIDWAGGADFVFYDGEEIQEVTGITAAADHHILTTGKNYTFEANKVTISESHRTGDIKIESAANPGLTSLTIGGVTGATVQKLNEMGKDGATAKNEESFGDAVDVTIGEDYAGKELKFTFTATGTVVYAKTDEVVHPAESNSGTIADHASPNIPLYILVSSGEMTRGYHFNCKTQLVPKVTVKAGEDGVAGDSAEITLVEGTAPDALTLSVTTAYEEKGVSLQFTSSGIEVEGDTSVRGQDN